MTAYGALLALLSAVMFGASTPASKLLLESFGPFQLAGLLYLGAALAMAPWHVRERSGNPQAGLDRVTRRRLVGAVVVGGIVGPVLLLFGLQTALAGSVSLLLNLEMIATAVLGVLFFGEHLGRAGWIGAVGAVLAGTLVSWEGGWPGVMAAALVTLACVCWGLDNHWTALIDGMSPARSTFWKGLVAGTTNLGIGLAIRPFEASPELKGPAVLDAVEEGRKADITLDRRAVETYTRRLLALRNEVREQTVKCAGLHLEIVADQDLESVLRTAWLPLGLVEVN